MPRLFSAILAIVTLLAAPASAVERGVVFQALTGGTYALADWRGRPVLVVNTASLCGYTAQFDDLQAIQDRYRDRGLVVLAVPSNDFRQELASDAEVADFCAVNFALDIPMAGITPVLGPQAHPFYRWLDTAHGVRPTWNFHKVLIGPDGAFAGQWPAPVRPTAPPVRRAIEAVLQP